MTNNVATRLLLLFILLTTGIAQTQAQIITTVAGTDTTGYTGDGGAAIAARLRAPFGIVVNSTGNVYFSDIQAHTIRKIDASGIIRTVVGRDGVAGGGYSANNRSATTALLRNPGTMGIDAAGNIYVADWGNNVIRKISTIDTITTVAGNDTMGYSGNGGPAVKARLNGPNIYVDPAGNIYIAEYNNHTIRKVNTSGIISLVAGIPGLAGSSPDGTMANAAAMNPTAITVDSAGNIYYVDEVTSIYRIIRKISSATGKISTYSDYWAQNMIFGRDGFMYFGDEACYVRKHMYGTAHTYAGGGICMTYGDGYLAKTSGLNGPMGLAFDPAGNLYIAERNGGRIRKITPYDPTVGVEDVAQNDGINVFPNPATDAFSIELPAVSGNVSIIITDLTGRVVTTRNVVAANGISEKISTNNLPAGAYLIKAIAGDKIYREKVLVR